MPTPTQKKMVDIHCHLIPGIDDGAKDLQESLRMARMAAQDGIGTIVVTPHQLGQFQHNTGDVIREATRSLQAELNKAKIPLRVLPGADVRIEESMIRKLVSGEVLSLADHRRHVLLELPHELYFPLEPILKQLESKGMVGILSHPERNQGILRQPKLLPKLVDIGCLMQVTSGSILGSMGPTCKELSDWMLKEGLVHFVSTDAHGVKSRRPLMSHSYKRVEELTNPQMAYDLFVSNPECVAMGKDVMPGRRKPARKRKGWFGRKAA